MSQCKEIEVWVGQPRDKVKAAFRERNDAESSGLRADWPQMEDAIHRLAELVYSDLPVQDGGGLVFDKSLDLAFDAYNRYGTSPRCLKEVVFGVTGVLMSILGYTISYAQNQRRPRRWEPMECTLYDLTREHGIRTLTLIEDEPHPLLKDHDNHRDAGIILASRVFTIRDMAAAGIIQ